MSMRTQSISETKSHFAEAVLILLAYMSGRTTTERVITNSNGVPHEFKTLNLCM